MAAGPIRGSFRPPSTTVSGLHSSDHNNGGNLKRNWKGFGKTSRDSPYTRPTSSSTVNGLVEKLTKAVKKVFSYIYQSDISQTESMVPNISHHETERVQLTAPIVKEQVPEFTIPAETSKEPLIYSNVVGDPTEVLSDLILNPLYKKSKQSTFRQIGLFFKAKGESKLSQYEFDQMSSILRRLSTSSVVVQQHFRYPLSSGTASVPSIIADQEPVAEPEPAPLQIIVKPSRIFSARYEVDGDEMDEESPVKSFNGEKIFIPVPTEPKLNIKEVPRQTRLLLKTSGKMKFPEAVQDDTKDHVLIAQSRSAGSTMVSKTFSEPSPIVNISELAQPTVKEVPKFFIPEIKPIKDSDLQASVAKDLKFDFGLPIIPPEDEIIKNRQKVSILPPKAEFASNVEPFAKKEEEQSKGFRFAQPPSVNQHAKSSSVAFEGTQPKIIPSFGQESVSQNSAGLTFSFTAQSSGKESSSVPKKLFTSIESRESQPLEDKSVLKPFNFEIPSEKKPPVSSAPFAFAPKKLPLSEETAQQAAIVPSETPKIAIEKQKDQPLFSFSSHLQTGQSAFDKPFSPQLSSEHKPFMFGRSTDTAPTASKSTFTFGQPPVSEQKPFAFGQPQATAEPAAKRTFFTDSQAPAEVSKQPIFGQSEGFLPFSLSSQKEKSSETSTFTFGQPSGEPKPFTFGQQQQQPVFTFGQSPPSQTGFSFGQSSQPFGSQTDTAKQAPSFGSFSQPLESSSAAAQFNFGSQPQSQPFVFGQADSNQAMTFSMGSSPATSTSGRKISTPVSRRKHLK